MKRYFQIIAILIMIFLLLLSACNKETHTAITPITELEEPTPTEAITTPTPTPIEPVEIVYVETYGNECAAISDTGDLYMWGNGESRPIKVMEDIESIAIGNGFYVVLTKDNEVLTWGDNEYGQLGIGDIKPMSLYEANSIKILDDIKYIDAGQDHALAITNEGNLYVWGRNNDGLIGTGIIDEGSYSSSSNSISTPTLILSNISQAVAGPVATMAITNTGDLYAWGLNFNGIIGNGNYLNEELDTYEDRIKYIVSEPEKILSEITNISSYYSLSAAVSSNNELYMWGYNGLEIIIDSDEIEYEDEERPFIAIPLKIKEDVSQVSLSIFANAYIDTEGNLYTWGNNEFGSLGNGEHGDGDIQTKDVIVTEPIFIMSDVIQVSTENNTIALTKDGEVYTWGNNESGQIGNGEKGDGDYETFDCFETLPVLIEFNPDTQSEKSEDDGWLPFESDEMDISLNGITSYGRAATDGKYVYVVASSNLIIIDIESNTYKEKYIRGLREIIGLHNDYIYYYSGDEIIKMKTDGTERILIYREPDNHYILRPIMNSQYLYYSIRSRGADFTDNTVYRMDLNNQNTITIDMNSWYPTFVDENYLYNDYDFSITDLDGNNRQELARGENFMVYNDWMFYNKHGIYSDFETKTFERNPVLFKMKIDGSDNQSIGDIETRVFNIAGDYIYYANLSDDGKLYSAKIDGSESKLILDIQNIHDIDICLGRLFIRYDEIIDEDTTNRHYISVMPDGSGLIKFD